MFAAFKPHNFRSQECIVPIKRIQSDSSLTLVPSKSVINRSQSFSLNCPSDFDLETLLTRIDTVQKAIFGFKWNVQSTWLHSIWAVKHRYVRALALESGVDDPIALAFQNDAISQKWLCLIRSIFLHSHIAHQTNSVGNSIQYQVGLSQSEKEKIASHYPSAIPLLIKTPFDQICSQKLTAKICDYFKCLTFSAEGWVEIRSDLSNSDKRLMMPWLLKIKMCNLLRDLQEHIDEGFKKPDLDDFFDRHFCSIPDTANRVYISDALSRRGECYSKLRDVLKAFRKIYNRDRMVGIEQIQGSIIAYISNVYTYL